ncbi:ATP-binding protein [Candidatus Electronema sp. PJ]|uniref:ATP-binding protein n=1 Tax=Candidatus Electronema sp. PJ TaxID=3401572 RepID=UPI003AA970E5
MRPLSLCFLVCKQMLPETQAAVQLQDMTGIEVRAFTANCAAQPADQEELVALIKESGADAVEIIGCRCLAQDLKVPGGRIRRAEQCVHLLCSPTLVRHLRQSGAGLLLPGWLARWQEHLAACGEDSVKMQIELFGQEVSSLVLLDTGTDEQAGWWLREMATFLNLSAEMLPVGPEYHGLLLTKIAAEHRQHELERQREQARQQAAQIAMILDMLGLVVKASSEPEALAGIAELFAMLFAPRHIRCLPVTKNGLPTDRLAELTAEEQQAAKQFLADSGRQHQLLESGDGFFLRIGTEGGTLAVVLVQQVAFPQHIGSYLNTALHLSGVCALAVEHANTLKKLLDTSRLAGKAEVATEVLHNVGNTLNSISVSAERLGEMVQKSGSTTLPAIVQLIEEHKNDPAFFDSDPKGRKLPLYFASLSEQLTKERWRLLEEIGHQSRHIRRAADIIRTQQDAVCGKALIEYFDLASVLDESVDIFAQKINERRITVERDYARLPVMQGEQRKILQIAGNLISNAIDSFDGFDQPQQKISLRLRPVGQQKEKVVIEIADNGRGISSEIMEHIFAFGFTAKKGGHGFGLHNAANLAAEMGGTLMAESGGEGQGAVFRLELPTTAGRRRGA